MTALYPGSRTSNAKLAAEPALQRHVTLHAEPSCRLAPDPQPIVRLERFGFFGPPTRLEPAPPPGGATGGQDERSRPLVTTADVLEALHRATGMNLVADHYTRLSLPEAVSVEGAPLFEALDQISEAMRLRWSREDAWLQFRSVSFYDDRLKEVPNRLLKRWAASRRQHGQLTLDDLIEIAQLTDAQLDAEAMAEGARRCWGMVEWEIARSPSWRLRPHLRYLASFSPAQRREAMSPAGLPFTQMSPAQQQQFIAFALEYDERPLQSLAELDGSLLRVHYTQPGAYEWWPPGPSWYRWAMPVGSGRRAPRPPVIGRTREEALQAARRTEPHVLEEMLREVRRIHPDLDPAEMLPQESQIVPTELDLVVIYMPGTSTGRELRVVRASYEFPANRRRNR